MNTTAPEPLSTPARRRFDVGDRVVHPRHGAGRVVLRRPRVVEGSARDYLEIELTAASLRIMVPCDATAAFCSMERPATATLRPHLWAADRAMWIRLMFEANVAMMT